MLPAVMLESIYNIKYITPFAPYGDRTPKGLDKNGVRHSPDPAPRVLELGTRLIDCPNSSEVPDPLNRLNDHFFMTHPLVERDAR